MSKTDTYTTPEMELALVQYFDARRNIIVPNVSFGFDIHECDLLILRPSGHAIEVEIKISRSDLKKDQKKRHNHHDRKNRIRELWFAVPDYLGDVQDLIPERAGIMTIRRSEWNGRLYASKVRDAKAEATAVKLDDQQRLKLTRLGTMRIWSLKRKIINLNTKLKTTTK
jgi:hypothetical protein